MIVGRGLGCRALRTETETWGELSLPFVSVCLFMHFTLGGEPNAMSRANASRGEDALDLHSLHGLFTSSAVFGLQFGTHISIGVSWPTMST